MSWSVDFERYMTNTVTITPYARMGMGGVPVWSTSEARTYVCRVVEQPTVFNSGTAQEKVATHKVWVGRASSDGSLSSASPRHRFQLDGSTVGLDAISVSLYPDGDGQHHQVIHLG